MIVGICVALLALTVNALIPHRARLIGVAVLLVPQLFILGSHFQITALAVFWTLITCLAGLATHGRSRADSALVVIVGLFVAVTAFSLLWAVPSGWNNGVAATIRGVVFMLWLREVIVVARDEPTLLDTIVLWTVPGVAVQSILTIACRLDPAFKFDFLHSQFAVITMGRSVERLYVDMWNNVIYAGRAGGFFVNGNQASLFGGVAALLFLISARRTGRRWLNIVAALSLTGSVFTGSKTAVFVSAGCVIAIILVPHMLKGWTVLAALPLLLLWPLAFSQLSSFIGRFAPTLHSDSGQSFNTREQMWSGGLELFRESPYLGLGFGGWEERIGIYTGLPNFPPHNFLVDAWSDSGILGGALAGAFVVGTVAFGVRVAAAQRTIRDRRTAVLALCAVFWVFAHGMADNTTMYGEQLSMILFGLAIAYLYAMRPGARPESAGSDDGSRLRQRDRYPVVAPAGAIATDPGRPGS